MYPRLALVLGATGLVGKRCLELLCQDESYDAVFALVRRPLELASRPPRLREHVIDFAVLGDAVATIAAENVFCCLGTTLAKAGSKEAFRQVDYHYPLLAARRAADTDCRNFLLVTATGADDHSSVFYNRVKGEVERDISALTLRAVHILRPSLLLGPREEHRPAEAAGQVAGRFLSPLFVGPLRKYRPIGADTVAHALCRIARADQAGRHIYLSDELERLGTSGAP
ncbi:MAG: oxidoreductase [Polyangia bacterium]